MLEARRVDGTPSDALGLRYFSIVLPNKLELQHVIERIQQAGIASEHAEHMWRYEPAGLSAQTMIRPSSYQF